MLFVLKIGLYGILLLNAAAASLLKDVPHIDEAKNYQLTLNIKSLVVIEIIRYN